MENPFDLNNLGDELRAEVEVKTSDLNIHPVASEWFQQIDRPVLIGALENFCLKGIVPIEVFLSRARHDGEVYEELILFGESKTKEKIKYSLARRKVENRES
jgi:hypothetical protein